MVFRPEENRPWNRDLKSSKAGSVSTGGRQILIPKNFRRFANDGGKVAKTNGNQRLLGLFPGFGEKSREILCNREEILKAYKGTVALKNWMVPFLGLGR